MANIFPDILIAKGDCSLGKSNRAIFVSRFLTPENVSMYLQCFFFMMFFFSCKQFQKSGEISKLLYFNLLR